MKSHIVYAPTYPHIAKTASDFLPECQSRANVLCDPWTEFRDFSSSPRCAFSRDQCRDRGSRGRVKLNKEDYFLFPDFIQEQCNRWFFHLQGERGRREVGGGAEGAGRGRGPGHELSTTAECRGGGAGRAAPSVWGEA